MVQHVIARPRSLALRPFISSLHYHESEFGMAVERILPNAQAHLMINLEQDEFRTYGGADFRTMHRTSGAVLAGPHGRFTGIDTAEQRNLVAVEFKPGGAAAFMRMPLNEASNQIVEVSEFWGREGCVLRERLCEAPTPSAKLRTLEAILLNHLVNTYDRQILCAVSLLDGGMPIAETRSRLGFLPKTFVRRFQQYVGLTPKRLARVRRLQRIVGSVVGRTKVDWCLIAAEHGYTDQAHLIHDFRDLAGITPAAYRPSSAQRRNHINV